MNISQDSIIVASKSQVSCLVDQETVILHFDKGVYYGLNDVGSLVWNKIKDPQRFGELRDAIASEYQVASEQCERDLRALLQDLHAQGLIEVRDATAD